MQGKLNIGPEEYAYARTVARRYFSNEEDVSDVVQEALLKAWKSYDGFKGESKFSTWLFRVVANTALMLLRKRKRDVVGTAKLAIEPTEKHYPSPETLLLAREALLLAGAVLQQLARSYRDAFVFRFLDDLTDKETAEAQQCNYATAKTRIFRSRHAVRAVLLAS